jgi:LysR family hydrogen peroxide-inducible transcriptional activator
MPITLRQMTYLAALADTGHFGRAAERCHVTQPALSQQIRQMEEYCGAPLFDRLGRTARLTPFGRDLLDRARNVLAAAEGFEDFVAAARAQPVRPLRFGLIPTVAPYLLPEIYPALRRELPHLGFTVSENRTEHLLSGLDDGALDLALIATLPPTGGPALETIPLFEDPFVLVTSASEALPAPISLDQLPPERVLLLDEGHCFRDQTIAACKLGGARGPRTFAATSLSTIVEFVANGQGVTLLPQIALRREAADTRLAIHPLADPLARRQLSMVFRRSAPHADLFRRIATVIAGVRRA